MKEEHEDKILIERAQENQEHFSVLYEKYVDRIFQFCYYRTGQHTETAEEMTAEVFIRSLRALPKFQWQGYPYSTYLYTVARSVCVQHYKKQQYIDDIDTISVAGDDDVTQNTKTDISLLWEHIATLPKATQELFELRYLEDLSYDHIAQIVGKSSGSVRTALSRAIKQLQKQYEKA